MGKCVSLIGKKFNRLTVIKRVGSDKYGNIKWLCICDCGNTTIVAGNELKRGGVKSCGCFRKQFAKQRASSVALHKKHGKRQTRLYTIWEGIKQRCYNEHSINYNNYGGRGIKVCDEWSNSFESFYNWAIQNGYEESLTIDRINNEDGYNPNNCRWVSNLEQQNNRRNNIQISHFNKTQSLSKWAKELNIPYHILYYNIKHGLSLQQIVDKLNKKKGVI